MGAYWYVCFCAKLLANQIVFAAANTYNALWYGVHAVNIVCRYIFALELLQMWQRWRIQQIFEQIRECELNEITYCCM